MGATLIHLLPRLLVVAALIIAVRAAAAALHDYVDAHAFEIAVVLVGLMM
jgi:hypothetical protein